MRLEARGPETETIAAVISDLVGRNAVRAGAVAKVFGGGPHSVLARSRSLWPKRSGLNVGPWATGKSARSFRTGQERDERGRFGRVALTNVARNSRGALYAGDVERGVYNWRASRKRIEANRYAVRRTWDATIESILRRLARERRRT